MQSSFTYDVYLSFRDEDTRRGFTGHLYKSLQQNGIRTFIDLQKLYTGSQIDPSLVKAIDESKIAIVIFSESYASSPFCLDELCIILDRVKGNGRFVLPIFYKVDRYEALSGFGFDDNDNIPKVKVQNWRLALQKAANLFSWSFTDRDGYEYEFIQKIVDYVSRRIDPASPLNVADYLGYVEWVE
ncbi:hypothetical protein RIF29_06290 [Crotalaria pallida]|uniref:TIR domain-containing protein n=1 Tax=Crotalaria pallida TaxID=3830 RepID=A0AAN9J315_CROPI